ncbi:hypothetical protein MRX96_055074 [Rhipicephalus microplus]
MRRSQVTIRNTPWPKEVRSRTSYRPGGRNGQAWPVTTALPVSRLPLERKTVFRARRLMDEEEVRTRWAQADREARKRRSVKETQRRVHFGGSERKW